ncbi:hypothetical protein [Thalassospira sp.]|uniref:hypothetical protein n=1 Tax=Thalassospira sp. TaxID=1912094 RepID=UPI0032F00F19
MAQPITDHTHFDVKTDPFTKRMPFGALLNRIVKYSIAARKRKAQRNVMDDLSHAQLADLGLQRKFNGMTWYVDRISNDLPVGKKR